MLESPSYVRFGRIAPDCPVYLKIWGVCLYKGIISPRGSPAGWQLVYKKSSPVCLYIRITCGQE